MSVRARSVIGGGCAYGALRARRMSIGDAISDRLTGETLRRAILRAYDAGELSICEIADEFGVNRMTVQRVIALRAKP